MLIVAIVPSVPNKYPICPLCVQVKMLGISGNLKYLLDNVLNSHVYVTCSI